MIIKITKNILPYIGKVKFTLFIGLLLSCSLLDLLALTLLFAKLVNNTGNQFLGELNSYFDSIWQVLYLFAFKSIYFAAIQYYYMTSVFAMMRNLLESILNKIIEQENQFKTGELSLEKSVLQNIKIFTEGLLISFFNFWTDICLIVVYVIAVVLTFGVQPLSIITLIMIVCFLIIRMIKSYSSLFGEKVNKSILTVSREFRSLEDNQKVYSVERSLNTKKKHILERVKYLTFYNKNFIFSLYQSRQIFELFFVFLVAAIISLSETNLLKFSIDIMALLAFLLRLAPVLNRLNISVNNMAYYEPIMFEVQGLKNSFNSDTRENNFNDEHLTFIDDCLSEHGLCLLTGPSGVGKSTLLNDYLSINFSGFPKSDIISSQEVRYFSQNFHFKPTKLIEFLGIEADEVPLFVAWLRTNFPKSGKFLVDKLSITSLANPYLIYENAENFSGGERTRLRLLKDLYKQVNFYALDEPSTGLNKEMVEELIKHLNKQRSINKFLIITHDYLLISAFKKYQLELFLPSNRFT